MLVLVVLELLLLLLWVRFGCIGVTFASIKVVFASVGHYLCFYWGVRFGVLG